jgi:hypothetical protein
MFLTARRSRPDKANWTDRPSQKTPRSPLMPGVGRQKLSVKSDSVQNPLAFAERIPPVKVFALDFRPGLECVL